VIVNTVRVGSEEQESNYLNNTASAIARVIGPLQPPAGGGVAGATTMACRTLTAEPRKLQVGTTSVVLATARNLFGTPLRGVSVQMLGLHVRQRATTDARGVARFTVIPRERGLISFGGTPRSTALARACRTVLGVVGAKHAPVTG
jgi:hypothetical protein